MNRRQVIGTIGVAAAMQAAPGRFHKDPHGSDRWPLGQLDFVERTEVSQVALEPEGKFDGRDFFGIAMGEVGDVAFAHVVAIAVGLAEVDGLVGFAVGGGPGGAGDLHVHIIREECPKHKSNLRFMPINCMSTEPRPKSNSRA